MCLVDMQLFYPIEMVSVQSVSKVPAEGRTQRQSNSFVKYMHFDWSCFQNQISSQCPTISTRENMRCIIYIIYIIIQICINKIYVIISTSGMHSFVIFIDSTYKSIILCFQHDLHRPEQRATLRHCSSVRVPRLAFAQTPILSRVRSVVIIISCNNEYLSEHHTVPLTRLT